MEIPKPSEQNVQSLLTIAGDLRFDINNYRNTKTSSEPVASPRKRRKAYDDANIDAKWQAAVTQTMDEHDLDNDGLPSVGLAFSESLYGSARNAMMTPHVSEKHAKGKGKRVSALDVAIVDRWTPPPQDLTLVIPGELVFAREQKGTFFWPAKLEEYIPPTKPSQKPKYKVRYLDETQNVVTRDMFVTADQDEFTTCKVRFPFPFVRIE